MKHKLLLALLSIALVSPSVWAAKGGKPPPIPQPNHVVWVDANGVMIGDAQTDVEPGIAYVYFEVNEKLYRTEYSGDLIRGFNTRLFYDRPECTGNAYVGTPLVRSGVEEAYWGRDGIFYAAAPDAPPQTVTIVSEWIWTTASCEEQTPFTGDYYPPVQIIDTNIYAKPYKLKIIPAN